MQNDAPKLTTRDAVNTRPAVRDLRYERVAANVAQHRQNEQTLGDYDALAKALATTSAGLRQNKDSNTENPS